MTGMTRFFATFWVENGEIVAPLNVMRFDDTIHRMLGSELEAVTVEQELLLSASNYYNRSTASSFTGCVAEGLCLYVVRYVLVKYRFFDSSHFDRQNLCDPLHLSSNRA